MQNNKKNVFWIRFSLPWPMIYSQTLLVGHLPIPPTVRTLWTKCNLCRQTFLQGASHVKFKNTWFRVHNVRSTCHVDRPQELFCEVHAKGNVNAKSIFGKVLAICNAKRQQKKFIQRANHTQHVSRISKVRVIYSRKNSTRRISQGANYIM